MERWAAESAKADDTVWVRPGGIARFTVRFGHHSFFPYAKTQMDCYPSPISKSPSQWGTHIIKGSQHQITSGTVPVQEISEKEAERGYP
ncbi:hypothetical protein PspLS_01840 [Pyricularia sp. CBS 133598]|nr:hypothetical protein PspLS_01840 [Pyricularia sp. CBS 133598]